MSRVPASLACCAALLLAAGCSGDRGQQRQNEIASDQIEEEGGDLSATRLISYFLVFQSNEQAARAAKDLRARGFSVNAEYSAGFGGGWLVVEKAGSVSHDLQANEALLGEVAAEYGGEYDGWEAATTP